MTNKPREFWIIVEKPYSTWVSNKPLFSADTDEEIHVIEYSAYQALLEQAERMAESLSTYVKWAANEGTLDKERADKAKELLRQWQDFKK